MVTYANLTILLADVHIDSGYLVVVTKDGADCENESDNGIFQMCQWRGTCAIPISPSMVVLGIIIGMAQVPRHRLHTLEKVLFYFQFQSEHSFVTTTK